MFLRVLRAAAGGAPLLAAALLASGCCVGDPNAEAKYGETTGLPANCRAIVQANIDGYRSGEFSADEAMSSLERNCGAYGYSWQR